MTITGLSNNYYFVHSPNMVHIEEPTAIKLEIKFTSGAKTLTGTFYPINGKFKVDISQYTKLFLPAFNDSRYDIGLNGGEYDVNYSTDVSIEFKQTLNDSSTEVQTVVKKFIHGISQPGEANFLNQGVHSIGDHVKVFSGYPFTINRLTSSTYKRIAAEIEFLGDINEYTTMNNLPSGPTYEIVKYPLTGIYLKWLNPKNDYSYWLFKDRNIVTGTISNLADTQIQIDNIVNQSELYTPSGVSVAETIKLFSQIPSKYQELIKTLFHSPEVYIYNLKYGEVAENPNAWSRVKITSGYNFKSFTRNERIEIEIQKVTQPLTMKTYA